MVVFSVRRALVLASVFAFAAVAPAIAANEATPIVIHAGFVSGAGERGIRDVKLTVDGQDVTDRASLTGIRVAYVPAAPLSEGDHVATVTVTDSLGRVFEKTWSFAVTGPAPVEIIAFFDDALRVEIDALPRTTRQRDVLVTGTTQPDAEVSLSLDDKVVAREIASTSGRFRARIALAEGENELRLRAIRTATGVEGEELLVRVALEVVTEEPGGEVTVPRPPFGEPGGPEPNAPGPWTPHVPGEVETPGDGGEVTAPRPPFDEPIGPEPNAPGPWTPHVPGDIALPGEEEPEEPPPGTAVVVITKPVDGDILRADHATVLGRAPARWTVVLFVDDVERASDEANPAGHFTMPKVEFPGGDHVLRAVATSAEGETAESVEVRITSGAAFTLGEATTSTVTLTSPARSSVLARASTYRVEGVAWDGAEIEVERNGAIVAREIAGTSGRFAIDVTLEEGANLVSVEAISSDGEQVARTPFVSITSRRAGTLPRNNVPPDIFAPPGSLPRPGGGMRPTDPMPRARP